MRWYAHVTQPLPADIFRGVLHLSGIQDVGSTYTDVTDAADFARFIAANRNVGAVIVYDSCFPRRQMTWFTFIEIYARKIWKHDELLSAFQEEERKRVADPNYTPTVKEALRNPAEFVKGMKEQ